MSKLSDPHIDLFRALEETQQLLRMYREEARIGHFRGDPATPFGIETLCQRLATQTGLPESYLAAGISVLYSSLKAEQANFPLWKIDSSIVDALLRTEPAPARYDPLPFPGLYLQIPPGDWSIQDPTTGTHRVVGVYLSETPVLSRSGDWTKGILCTVVGEVKSISVLGLNDATIFFALSDERPDLASLAARDGRGPLPAHGIQAETFCRNFLYALRTRNLSVVREEVKVPKSGKKRARAERRGELREFSTVRISARAPTQAPRSATPRATPSDRKGPRPHIRRAHFRHLWTLTAEDGFLECREREGRPPLYRVARWVLMTQVGAGETARPKSVVR